MRYIFKVLTREVGPKLIYPFHTTRSLATTLPIPPTTSTTKKVPYRNNILYIRRVSSYHLLFALLNWFKLVMGHLEQYELLYSQYLPKPAKKESGIFTAKGILERLGIQTSSSFVKI